MEQLSDQSALPNLNANWVNAKGKLYFSCNGEATLFHLLPQFLLGRLELLPWWTGKPLTFPNSGCQLPFSLKLTYSFSLGAWTIHIVLIIILKILFNTVPGVSQETSWTLTNIIYMFGSYLMFHYVRGVPFEFNAGAYDNLNMWEQIDNGDQYTPTKKFLLSVPICLFLLSTHYTHYDLTYFMINFLAVLSVVIPKLPSVSSFVSACAVMQ